MDPLSPSNVNAGWGSPPSSATSTRPLPTSPYRPALPTSASSSSFREPKIFGAPGMGLVDPASQTGSSSGQTDGNTGDRRSGVSVPFLRVRLGALERNRKDLLIRFDASTNLPNFRTSMYRNMQRSYAEFQRFAEQAQLTSPQTIIPALPLPSTSAVTDEEDDRLVRLALQRWISRICEDQVLMKDDELRSFIESDFGYSPIPPPSARRPTTASSAVPNVLSAAISKVVRRGPLDEDDDLQAAKGTLEKLESGWGGAATSVSALGKARRAHALATADVGAKLISLSTVESDLQLQAAERKIGRAFEHSSAIAVSENVVMSDTLGYHALNARAAKEALIQRTQLLEDSQTATKSAITKRRNVERLKGSSHINPTKVDDAISEMEEANVLEISLSSRLTAISQNLHAALRTHSKNAHEDVTVALLENARFSIGFHRAYLKELEALRPDIAKIGTNASITASSKTATPNTMPTPSYSMPPPPTPQSRTFASPPTPAPPMDGTRSMFLPPQAGPPVSASTQPASVRPDPLGGGMAQSMMLPNQGQNGQRAQTMGRAGARRLDERQVAKLLAGGF